MELVSWGNKNWGYNFLPSLSINILNLLISHVDFNIDISVIEQTIKGLQNYSENRPVPRFVSE